MTPEELSSFFIQHGYHPKMKSFISSSGKTKYKLAKNSLQKFRKSDNFGWMKVMSAYYKDITINTENGLLYIAKRI